MTDGILSMRVGMLKVTNVRPATLNAEDHIYTDIDGVKALFSISQIAGKGKTLPEMKHIKNAALTGTYFHELMHKIIRTQEKDQDGFFNLKSCLQRVRGLTLLSEEEKYIVTHVLELIIDYTGDNKITRIDTEVSLMADFNGVPVAGTADLIIFEENKLHIMDFKTGKMSGFKSEHHLQLFGYSLFQEIKAGTTVIIHPEGLKHLFDLPGSPWVAEEFEENFNYLLNKEKEIINIEDSEGREILEYCTILEFIKEKKSSLSTQLKQYEAEEKKLLAILQESLETIGLNEENIAKYQDLEVSMNKSRRHILTYRPDLEKYYDCSVSEEFLLTQGNKKIKVKLRSTDNE